MFNGIIAIENRDLKSECLHVLQANESIRIHSFPVRQWQEEIGFANILFLITDRLDFNKVFWSELKGRKVPRIPFIYYSRSLLLANDSIWNPRENLYFVVGEERKQHLARLIKTLLKNHWRRIPYEKLGLDYNRLSPRMKKVMEYIETTDLQNCDIFHIANYLKITPGYFSQLFKHETGVTFRRFMQEVLNYYENLLFLDWKLDVKSVSRLLGYSELSSYSRSFKNRKGQSPRAYAKLRIHP